MTATPSNWHRVYSLADDSTRIEAMRRASLSDDPTIGLLPDPLVGSARWWHELRSGERSTIVIEGTISRVYWGSMADYPEVAVRTPDGSETTWTREGDIRRYAPGLAARIAYTEHPRKAGVRSASEGPRRVALQVDVEESDRRSPAVAPGPGGAGYDLARRLGEACHYLAFTDQDAAQRAVAAVPGRDRQAAQQPRVWGGAERGGWFLTVWRPTAGAVCEDYVQLERAAVSMGGRYDGGEIIDGACWGPSGPPSTKTSS